MFAAVGAAIFGAFQVGKMPATLPVLRDDLGLSLFVAGWAISIFNVIGSAAGVVLGALADLLGHRRVILFGLLCMATGSALGALAGDGPQILATRFLEGLGGIVVFIAGPGLIVRALQPGDMRLAFGVWGTYMPTGTSIMVVSTPLLIVPFGWRGLWAANALLLAGYAVLFALATRRYGGPSGRPRRGIGKTLLGLGRDMHSIFTVPGPIVLALCFGGYTANFLAVLGFLPTFLIEDRGVSNVVAAALTALAVAVNVPGNLFGGFLLHRGVPRWPLIATASLAMAAASFGIYSSGVPDGLRYLLCLAFSMLGGLLPVSVLGGGPLHAPRPGLVATTNGLIMQGSNLGQLAGPPAMAALVAFAGGWHAAPWQVTGLACVSIVLALWIGVIERRWG